MSLAGTILALKVSGIAGTLFILLSMAVPVLAAFIFIVFLGYSEGPSGGLTADVFLFCLYIAEGLLNRGPSGHPAISVAPDLFSPS